MSDAKKWCDEPLTVQADEAAKNLAKWDRGDSVWSIEMGGLGPSYEQCIQNLAIEIVRTVVAEKPTTKEAYTAIADRVASEQDKRYGFSGAQVGVAQNLAWRLAFHGWDAAIQSADEDRRIQVDNRLVIA